ncbi:uncharacterized protein LOC122544524 isoform X4 [Chiloscyllium plagiosum]|uniref:uncharacterized protein LOC122544524 isoform X4 n=1 Tax=Chiloscyllium plagiosum TaxID=36176 RepID=UPI001CB7FC3F|nr:uncharacterized protein LOC122544524 isoform X4 [Chiloscyllium plagiosum]
MFAFSIFLTTVHFHILVEMQEIYQLSKPNIKALSDSDANSSRDIVSISCQGDIRPSGGIFSFYNSRRKDFRQEYHVTGLEDTAVITINIHEHSSAGNYSCRYKTEVNGRSILSPFSQSVSVTEKRKDDHTSKAAQKRLYMFVGLGCAAVIIVLLVVLCLLIVKKGQNKRQNIPRTASTAVQITDSKDQDGIYDNANLIYCNSMGEYSKVHDNNCESVTYAALNIEVSNQNTSASVVREELCMYMDVKT